MDEQPTAAAPAAAPGPTIVNDPIDPPMHEKVKAAARAKDLMRKGMLGVPTREARERVPLMTALRRAGHEVAGIHPTNDRGQYIAKDIGPNDPCPCNWNADHPHKYKRHEKVAGPLIRESLNAALAAAQAKEAAKAAEVPTVPVEPTTGST